MRRSTLIAIVLLAIAVLFVAGPSLLFSPSATDVAPERDDEPTLDLVTFEDSESGFWPYLSSEQAYEQRSPINVIVRGEPEAVVRALTAAGADWEEMDEEDYDAEPETFAFIDDQDDHATGIAWGEADGTTRYAWIDSEAVQFDDSASADDADSETDTDSRTGTATATGTGTGTALAVNEGPNEGEWATETLQLQDGDYYGYRYHIRVYASPNSADEWVAMQAHSEHFDWFTLRHRVDGVESAQLKVESDLMALPQVDSAADVKRINIGNAGPADSDGWATVVDLRSLLLVPIAVGFRRRARADSLGDRLTERADDRLTDVDRRRLDAAADRIEPGHVVMVLSIIALLLGVRVGGIALERHAEFLSAHAIAALLYPVIAIGIPVTTYRIAQTLTRRLDAAVVASCGLAVAIWIDYGLVGVDSLPIDVVVGRMLLVVALGLIAGGGTERASRGSRFNDMLLGGCVLWVLVLFGTLFGYV